MLREQGMSIPSLRIYSSCLLSPNLDETICNLGSSYLPSVLGRPQQITAASSLYVRPYAERYGRFGAWSFRSGQLDSMLILASFQGLPTDVVGNSSMFTGEEEVFAFARACSRLVQMGSKEWAETAGNL